MYILVLDVKTAPAPNDPRLTAPQVAFTPHFGFASNGTDIDYAMLLRTSFTVGAKLSNDSAIQMLRIPGQSVSSAEHKVDDFYTKIKVALAYAETSIAEECNSRTK